MKPLLKSLLLLAALAIAPPLAAADGRLGVELNKTEEIDGGGCRAFFLFRNSTGKSFAGFEMSLAVLDGNGIKYARRSRLWKR